jgi:uncharacterized damage-inducible protein DinB
MDLRYPIGEFEFVGEISEEQRNKWIDDIEEMPEQLKSAVKDLSEEQLNTPYREGGWTIRQVVHHIADSHMNSLIRFKLALTEEEPSIKPYYEDRWAELGDTIEAPIDLSLSLLEALHKRWVLLLRTMKPADFDSTFYHPQSREATRLDKNLGIYAWHGKHHIAHITSLRSRLDWK